MTTTLPSRSSGALRLALAAAAIATLAGCQSLQSSDGVGGLLKLHQDAVHRCEADIGILAEQDLVDILGAHVALRGLLEYLEHLDARQRRLQSAVLQFVGVRHGEEVDGGRVRAGCARRASRGPTLESPHHIEVAGTRRHASSTS